MEELPNGWTWEAARDRAMALLGENVSPGVVDAKVPWGCIKSVARYIAQHEKPSVDPDLMLLADILRAARAVSDAYAEQMLVGEMDDDERAALKLLKERK